MRLRRLIHNMSHIGIPKSLVGDLQQIDRLQFGYVNPITPYPNPEKYTKTHKQQKQL